MIKKNWIIKGKMQCLGITLYEKGWINQTLEKKELESSLEALDETRAVLMSYKQDALEKLGEKYYEFYKDEEKIELQKIIAHLEEIDTALIQLEKKVIIIRNKMTKCKK